KRRSISRPTSPSFLVLVEMVSGKLPCQAEGHAAVRWREHLLVLAGGLAFELAARTVQAGRGAGRQIGPVPDVGRFDAVEAPRQPAGLEVDGVHPAHPAAAVTDRFDDLVVPQPHALAPGQRPAQGDLHAVRRRAELPDPGYRAAGGHTQGDRAD